MLAVNVDQQPDKQLKIDMDIQNIQILESLVILIFYVVAFFITKTIINNVLKNTQLQEPEER